MKLPLLPLVVVLLFWDWFGGSRILLLLLPIWPIRGEEKGRDGGGGSKSQPKPKIGGTRTCFFVICSFITSQSISQDLLHSSLTTVGFVWEIPSEDSSFETKGVDLPIADNSCELQTHESLSSTGNV